MLASNTGQNTTEKHWTKRRGYKPHIHERQSPFPSKVSYKRSKGEETQEEGRSQNIKKKKNVEQKMLKTAEKKYFYQLLGVRSTRKLVKIQNKK